MGSNFSCTPSDPPVYQYMLEWLETRKYVLQPSTYNSYEGLINGRIKKYYSSTGLTVTSLKPADIRAFYMGIFRDGCSPATVIHYHVVMRKAFQQVFKEDLIPCNPFDKVDRPRADKYHVSFLHEEELAILLQNAANDPMYIVIYLTSVFGLRRSEALGVRWSRIDFEQKRILFDTIDKETVEQVQKSLEANPNCFGLPSGLFNSEGSKVQKNSRLCLNPAYLAAFRSWLTEKYRTYPGALTLTQAAELSHLSPNCILLRIKRKEIFASLIGTRYVISKRSIIEYISSEKVILSSVTLKIMIKEFSASFQLICN